jgi:hypothetical protein
MFSLYTLIITKQYHSIYVLAYVLYTIGMLKKISNWPRMIIIIRIIIIIIVIVIISIRSLQQEFIQCYIIMRSLLEHWYIIE